MKEYRVNPIHIYLDNDHKREEDEGSYEHFYHCDRRRKNTLLYYSFSTHI